MRKENWASGDDFWVVHCSDGRIYMFKQRHAAVRWARKHLSRSPTISVYRCEREPDWGPQL